VGWSEGPCIDTIVDLVDACKSYFISGSTLNLIEITLQEYFDRLSHQPEESSQPPAVELAGPQF